jgi:hypothetical protein
LWSVVDLGSSREDRDAAVEEGSAPGRGRGAAYQPLGPLECSHPVLIWRGNAAQTLGGFLLKWDFASEVCRHFGLSQGVLHRALVARLSQSCERRLQELTQRDDTQSKTPQFPTSERPSSPGTLTNELPRLALSRAIENQLETLTNQSHFDHEPVSA